ncbi:MAG: PadR family transcriptional regulator [Haloglomus sp.]
MGINEDDDTARAETPATIKRLRAEFVGDDGERDGPDTVQGADELLDEVVESFFSAEFAFSEETVKGDLEEILLTLVAHRSAETSGTQLIDDLGRLFDADLSPGTVYPRLHALEAQGLLERHELVRTKEYLLDDTDACCDRIAAEMRQHLALALFYHRALAAF